MILRQDCSLKEPPWYISVWSGNLVFAATGAVFVVPIGSKMKFSPDASRSITGSKCLVGGARWLLSAMTIMTSKTAQRLTLEKSRSERRSSIVQ